MEKKCRKAKWLSGKGLQIAVKRRKAKSKGEKERYKHLNAEFQRIAPFKPLSGLQDIPVRLERRAESFASPRDEA